MHCVICWMLVTLFTYLIFILKCFTLVSTVFIHNEIMFCNSKDQNGSRETLRVLSRDRCKRRVKSEGMHWQGETKFGRYIKDIITVLVRG